MNDQVAGEQPGAPEGASVPDGGSEDLSWVRNSRFTIEYLRERAAGVLGRIDRDREIERLLRQGLTPDEVIDRTGAEPRFVAHVGQQMQRAEPVRPESPEELIYRRFLGQITSREMMDRLRAWPWTFGRLRGYDGYERGSWDDVDSLGSLGYLSDQEYAELEAITDPMPKPPDDPMPWEKGWQPQ